MMFFKGLDLEDPKPSLWTVDPKVCKALDPSWGPRLPKVLGNVRVSCSQRWPDACYLRVPSGEKVFEV